MRLLKSTAITLFMSIIMALGIGLLTPPEAARAGSLPDSGFGNYSNEKTYTIDPATGQGTASKYGLNSDEAAHSGESHGHYAQRTIQAETNSLANFIMIFVRMAGVIVIAAGVIKMIMALNEHMPMGKITSFNMIALGIVLLGVSFTVTSIVDAFVKSGATGMETSAEKLEPILIIMKVGFYTVGILLALVGLIKVASSFQSERPEEKLEGGRMVAIAAALVSCGYIISGIATRALGTDAQKNVFEFLMKDIAVPIVIIMAVPLLLSGILNLAESFREDNPAAKARAIPQFITSMLMISIGTILGIV